MGCSVFTVGWQLEFYILSHSTGHSLSTDDNKLKYNRNLTGTVTQCCDSFLKRKGEDDTLVHHKICKC